MSPFDFVTSINSKEQTNLIDQNPDCEREYTPFLTNRSLSYFRDTILFSNEMNLRHGFDKKPQYDYYINTIRPQKRYNKKWAKRDILDIDKLELISEYYECNITRSMEYSVLLTDTDIEEIRKRMYKGGITHDKRNGTRSN